MSGILRARTVVAKRRRAKRDHNACSAATDFEASLAPTSVYSLSGHGASNRSPTATRSRTAAGRPPRCSTTPRRWCAHPTRCPRTWVERWGPGRASLACRRLHRGWLLTVPPGRRDRVQHRVRSPRLMTLVDRPLSLDPTREGITRSSRGDDCAGPVRGRPFPITGAKVEAAPVFGLSRCTRPEDPTAR